jgi:hypothetical protein
MGLIFTATLNLWPASPLPANVAYELRLLGFLNEDLEHLETDSGQNTLHRTNDGGLGLQLRLYDCEYGITGIEGLLELLRTSHVNYTVWDTNGIGRCFDATTGEEQLFTVLANGEAVITAPDLASLAQHDSTQALLTTLRRMLLRTTPPFSKPLDPKQTTLTIRTDDPTDDELGPPTS